MLRTIIVLTVVVVLVVVGTNKTINTVSINNSSHTFCIYNNIIDGLLGNNAIDTLEIPIDTSTGNYIHNPGKVEFLQYLALCVLDTSKFSLIGYSTYILD